MGFFKTISNGTKGILFLLFAIALISVQDVIVKFLSGSNLPLHELLTIRYVLALIMFGWLIVFVSSYDGLRTEHLGKQFMRGGISFMAGFAYYLALSTMPVAETVAIFFSAPLFVTLLSVLILKEKAGLHRWVAVAIGFVGVLIMVRPGGEVFNPMAFLVIFSAICYAGSMLLARAMGNTESAVNMSFYAMVSSLAGALTVSLFANMGWLSFLATNENFNFLTAPWVMPNSSSWLLIGGIALITVFSFHSITQAYRIAPPSLLALFEYSTMFWAILWGVTIFSHYPDGYTMIGIVLVVIAGLYTIAHEAWTGKGHKKWFTGRGMHHHR